MANDRRALIAMSGGVDSSVCTLLMRAAGYTCEGATMRLYRNADIGLSQYHGCCTQRDIDDAADVAFTLDMPFHILDYTAEFRQAVIEKFISTYEAGGTPNPCIDCNRSLKFGALLSYAAEHGFDCVATGHYARIQYDAASERYLLRRALDASKDQSYVLYMLTQAQLARLRFPLGDHTKAQARETALRRALENRAAHFETVAALNRRLRAALLERSGVRLNSPEGAIPHILNLSVDGVRGARFQQMLDEMGVCVSVKSACATDGAPSAAVLALCGDRRNAPSSWRVSLSHLTTDAELDGFLAAFDVCCRQRLPH